MLNRIKPQAPLLAVPFRRTTQGHAPPPVEPRESYQFVNPDHFDFSKGAGGVIKLTSQPCMVKLCFVVCLFLCVSVVCV